MLSPLEKACLLWVSQGKSAREISLLAGRTITEIETCLTGVRASLGINSLEDAIEQAKLMEEISKDDAEPH